MIDAHIFRLPSTNLSQESKEIKGITYSICIKLDYNHLKMILILQTRLNQRSKSVSFL